MHDEGAAIDEISKLSLNAKAHLSHIIRNGICNILWEHSRGDISRAVENELKKRLKKLEGEMTKLGL